MDCFECLCFKRGDEEGKDLLALSDTSNESQLETMEFHSSGGEEEEGVAAMPQEGPHGGMEAPPVVIVTVHEDPPHLEEPSSTGKVDEASADPDFEVKDAPIELPALKESAVEPLELPAASGPAVKPSANSDDPSGVKASALAAAKDSATKAPSFEENTGPQLVPFLEASATEAPADKSPPLDKPADEASAPEEPIPKDTPKPAASAVEPEAKPPKVGLATGLRRVEPTRLPSATPPSGARGGRRMTIAESIKYEPEKWRWTFMGPYRVEDADSTHKDK